MDHSRSMSFDSVNKVHEQISNKQPKNLTNLVAVNIWLCTAGLLLESVHPKKAAKHFLFDVLKFKMKPI